MILVRLLLLPFLPFFYIALKIRHLLYDTNVIKSEKPPVFSICIGNLKAGGTGKTPFVNLLISQLKPYSRILFVSRGYGRATKGFVECVPSSSAREIGDEPRMTLTRHPGIRAAVCEKRMTAIREMLLRDHDTDTIVLDDAFQHRAVDASLNILLTEYEKPYFSDRIFPLGNLRDLRRAALRADMIVVTKTPLNTTLPDMDAFVVKMNPRYGQKVFFSAIDYLPAVPVFVGQALALVPGGRVIALSGIASADYFEQEIASKYELIKSFRFRDHADYSVSDLEKVAALAVKENAMIITTEKDAVKIDAFDNLPETFCSRAYLLPITYRILEYRGANINTLMNEIKKARKQ